MTRRWPLIVPALWALLSLVASTACLALTPGATPGPATPPAATLAAGATVPAGTPTTALGPTTAPADTQAAATPTPLSLVSTTDQGNVSVSVPGDVTFGPGAFDWVEAGAGLADLASYTASLSVAFNGTQAGQAQQWSRTYVLLSAREPAARQLTVAKTGANGDPDPVFLAEVAGTAYEQHGAGDCTAAKIDPAFSLVQPLEPAGFLTGVIGAEAAGSDTVNGVAADHYTFDERALGLDGLATASGELWVAHGGGYLLKYVLKTQGEADYFGEGLAGALTLDYELTGVNQPVAVALPAGCPPGVVEAPQLPDAAHLQDLPGWLSYDTASSLGDAAAFYQAQLPGLGWAMPNPPAVAEGATVLEFTRADETLTVILSTAAAGGTSVTITLSKVGQ